MNGKPLGLTPFKVVELLLPLLAAGGHPAGDGAFTLRAVGAARRLHCGARPGVASLNSLRSLRSLRSNKRSESDVDARCASRPQSCEGSPRCRARSGRPSPRRRTWSRGLRSHRPTNRPQRMPPAALNRLFVFARKTLTLLQRWVRAGRCGAPVRRREGGARTGTVQWTVPAWRAAGPLARCGLQGQGSWPRAQRASTSDSSPVSERSERSERSEFGDGPRTRASQGSRSAAQTPHRSAAAACPHPPLPLRRSHETTNSDRPQRAESRRVTACRQQGQQQFKDLERGGSQSGLRNSPSPSPESCAARPGGSGCR